MRLTMAERRLLVKTPWVGISKGRQEGEGSAVDSFCRDERLQPQLRLLSAASSRPQDLLDGEPVVWWQGVKFENQDLTPCPLSRRHRNGWPLCPEWLATLSGILY